MTLQTKWFHELDLIPPRPDRDSLEIELRRRDTWRDHLTRLHAAQSAVQTTPSRLRFPAHGPSRSTSRGY